MGNCHVEGEGSRHIVGMSRCLWRSNDGDCVTPVCVCMYVCMHMHDVRYVCTNQKRSRHTTHAYTHTTPDWNNAYTAYLSHLDISDHQKIFLYQTKTTWVNTTAFSKFWFHLVVVKKILNLLSPMWKCNSVKVSVHNPTTWKRMRKKGIQGRIPRWKPFLTRKNTKPRLTFEPHGFWENIPWTDETKTELFWCKNKDGDVKTPALNDSKETKSRFWIRIVKVWT